MGYPAPMSIADLWTTLVPEYRSTNYGPAIFKILWDPRIASKIELISARRSSSRIKNYVIPSEIERVKQKLNSKDTVSVRLGYDKKGHGYSGERGDFCLIAGVVSRKRLTVYYRSLELIGGFAYDLVLLKHLGIALETYWETVTFVTAKAFVFALKGNSNEKLYPKLQKILN